MTYRLVGHMIGDNEVYRTKAEVAGDTRDMIVTFPQRLVGEFGVTTAQITATESDIAAEMAETVRFAEEARGPTERYSEDVWA